MRDQQSGLICTSLTGTECPDTSKDQLIILMDLDWYRLLANKNNFPYSAAFMKCIQRNGIFVKEKLDIVHFDIVL